MRPGVIAEPASPSPVVVSPLLEVVDLRTFFFSDSGTVRAVDGINFTVRQGETLGIVGESGSGKSATASSIMRLIPWPGRVVSGEIRFEGRDIGQMSEEEVRALRGGRIALVFQDSMTSLNPVLRVASQLEEAMLVHGRYDRRKAGVRAVDLLGRMHISGAERAVQNFPHQFSGGMRQRVMLAMGFSNDPSLLIADEPTTALDVTVQAQILDLLRELNQQAGVAIILISHDLGVVANLCSRIAVMYAGQIVEEGPTAEILATPRHPYTWALINAVPRIDEEHRSRLVAIEGLPPDLVDPPTGCRFADRCPFRMPRCADAPDLIPVGEHRLAACWYTRMGADLPVRAGTERNGLPAASQDVVPAEGQGHVAVRVGESYSNPPPATASGDVLLQVDGLTKHFPLGGGAFGRSKEIVHAVDGVDLAIRAGETMGLVGESGSGKSTLARVLVRLYEPTSGGIAFEGRDISHLSGRAMRPLRRRLQMIFQDPYSSLNPRMTVGQALTEPLLVHGLAKTRGRARTRVAELLSLVGLDSKAAAKYPYEFSGGQRQRIGIARALAMGPRFLVADEPVSSLDVNIQAQVINLLGDLQEELGLTYLFIAHDLSVVRHVSDRISVMYLGKIVEVGPSDIVCERPLHPYAAALISAVPVLNVEREQTRRRIRLQGEIPSPIHPPTGCRFRTRCPIAQVVCAEQEPMLKEHRPARWAACHFPGQM